MPDAAHARHYDFPNLPAPISTEWLEAILSTTRLSASARLLGIALAWHAGRTGGETPSANELMSMCGFRTAERLIDARLELEHGGWIGVKRDKRRITRYVLAGAEAAL